MFIIFVPYSKVSVMKSLIFSDYELQELKNFYEHQMQKMRERMELIQNILDKVAGEAFAVAEAVLAAESRQEKPGASGKNLSAEEILEKSGLRATKWNKFIISTLLRLRRPLTIQELSEMAAKEFKVAPKELDKMRLTINQALIRIRKSNAVKEYKIKGLKNKYFGLEAWFDGNRLLEDFQKMLGGPAAEKEPVKRGRKAKAASEETSARGGRKKKAAKASAPKAKVKKSRARKAGRKSGRKSAPASAAAPESEGQTSESTPSQATES